MVGPCVYEPPADRDSYLRKNVLKLASTLSVLRSEGTHASGIDRLLARAPSTLRFIALIMVLLLCSLAKNMAFVWVLLAVELVLLCTRPAKTIAQIIAPALVATILAVIVNLPAAIFFGQTSAPIRVGSKMLVNLLIVGSYARTTTPEDLLAGLAHLGLPATVTLTIDLTLRDLILIGSEAETLSEALELRSVGKNTQKTEGVTGVLGMCFLRAERHARQQAEAMRLRGFDGTVTKKQSLTFSVSALVYILIMACVPILFFYLEAAL